VTKLATRQLLLHVKYTLSYRIVQHLHSRLSAPKNYVCNKNTSALGQLSDYETGHVGTKQLSVTCVIATHDGDIFIVPTVMSAPSIVCTVN